MEITEKCCTTLPLPASLSCSFSYILDILKFHSLILHWYRGTYLTDLTFIEDGNPDYIQGLVNYRKRELVYSVIREIQQYQQASYTFELVNIAHFLTELPSNDENSLYDLSLLREPRNATIDQIV